jgi:hypothetical protein
MKTKSLILIAFAAIITLSFSFAASNRSEKITVKETATTQVDQSAGEPLGGFIAEDQL